ncbi:ankyrin [Annulohypoxylon bovei var. microspora]|nr:ankyrin [Annulohypoxylon bovei var. microspora]
MQLLDLPVEILHDILFFASLSRGIARALRLKLVCRTFYHAINPALFQTRLPDQFPKRPRIDMENWWTKNHRGDEGFWHDYISYRVRNESNPRVGYFVQIRQLVERICNHEGVDFDSTLDALCWPLLKHAARKNRQSINTNINHRRRGFSYKNSDLLSAAAYLGYISVAKQKMEEGCCPFAKSLLFPAPVFLAAFAGNVEMLQLFREHSPVCSWGRYYDRILLGVIHRRGTDMVQLLTNSSPIASPDEQPEILSSYLLRKSLRGPPEKQHMRDLLRYHAEWGDVNTVRQILDEGIIDNNDRNTYLPPYMCESLTNATKRGQEEIVDLLLDHGTDPNREDDVFFVAPLVAAAAAGSLAIMRKLLDHGAKLERNYYRVVQYALRLEHTAMLEFLLERGPYYRDQKIKLKRLALEEGLESMAEIVERSECNTNEDDLCQDDLSSSDSDDGEDDSSSGPSEDDLDEPYNSWDYFHLAVPYGYN